MVDAVCALGDNQPKFVHVSTVALYGHRNYLHPWGRVGDPLLPSVYDVYAATKLKGERYVLDSPLKCWAVLRQTAMLHYNMMKDNMSDGLMFHTCVNVPLEWSTSKDSGLLVKRIVEKDLRGEVDSFWKKCYNIGGGEKNRVTGYDSYDKLLGTIGSRAEKVMKPGWHSIRNFHGLWFADGDVLNDMFDFQHDTYDDFCDAIVKNTPYTAQRRLCLPNSFRKSVSNDCSNTSILLSNGSKSAIREEFAPFSEAPKTSNAWQKAGRISLCLRRVRLQTATSTTTQSERRRTLLNTDFCSITVTTKANPTANSTFRICATQRRTAAASA